LLFDHECSPRATDHTGFRATKQEGKDGADSRGWERGQNRDRMDVTFIQHPEQEGDRKPRAPGEIDSLASKMRQRPVKFPWKANKMPSLEPGPALARLAPAGTTGRRSRWGRG